MGISVKIPKSPYQKIARWVQNTCFEHQSWNSGVWNAPGLNPDSGNITGGTLNFNSQGQILSFIRGLIMSVQLLFPDIALYCWGNKTGNIFPSSDLPPDPG
jgi:hypothetical protein